jgi:hypothetical protein
MANVALKLGQPTTVADGIYFGVAAWSAKARDYLDIPGLYGSESEARAHSPMGTRLVRWSVADGSVTTRRGLR